MHNIFQPLSSVALLQQRRQHHLKEEQLKWELADWDLATRKQKAGYCQCTAKKKSQSLLPSNAHILNLMLVNLFIIVFILLVIHCVWQNNKIKINK